MTETDFIVSENVSISPLYGLLKLSPTSGEMPVCRPGQFVQVEVPNSKTTFLRRPISICYVDEAQRHLWLLIRKAGEGTSALLKTPVGSVLNLVLPLGNGFSTDFEGDALLIGGGVGVAPLLQLGKTLHQKGKKVKFLLGARTASDLLLPDEFRRWGEVYVTTEDGSAGEKGFVTQHPILQSPVSHLACCGPLPMMKAVAAIARSKELNCEVSLENMMACGLGACLCCVEDTADSGHVCVCKEGPVFNIHRLKW